MGTASFEWHCLTHIGGKQSGLTFARKVLQQRQVLLNTVVFTLERSHIYASYVVEDLYKRHVCMSMILTLTVKVICKVIFTMVTYKFSRLYVCYC